MKKPPLVFSLFDDKALAKAIHSTLKYELGELNQHQFPDTETVITIDTDVAGRELIFTTSLNHPNQKLLPLIFAARTAKELGATRITLIAPYLAYMRQDKQFQPGQGITSKYFAELLSHYFDALITLDPHLHRWHSLNDIYTIPATALHANDRIADWIKTQVSNPILIGPDAESAQWVNEIATLSNSPYLILEKTRKGDRAIEVSIPHIERYQTATPILIDDIISTGMTLLATINHLAALNLNPPICIGIHAIFAGDAYQRLLASRIKQIITCNTIQHISNGIDIYPNIIHYLNQEPA